jgi:hypothetical protein
VLLKPFNQVYLSFKEALRILRKMKYDVQWYNYNMVYYLISNFQINEIY